ncbi:hypothetical protein IQ215_12185 [Cyanobacterium stanieri LEGE 03274]|uniref:Protein TIC 20 n=1 Tax=Cyanobacterium stanieri LEGE 03274 TaxID=1828756 RepID=A0ABR9V7G3_9CHRO|nr:Tic20 family protein [Cyanobacterium stanieri]MBE9223456.1 hypothetical protein [Cyanobacterium stanieri LEGE 03274]
MTRLGSSDWKDKLFSTLVYLIPLYYVLEFGGFLFNQFPFLRLITIPLIPLIYLYSLIPFARFIIFIALFALVIRNSNLSHFLRYNAMQAILIDILLILVNLIVGILAGGIGGLFMETLYNMIFLGTLVACVYCMFQSVTGKYAELPGISEAAYSQVPF